MLRSLGHDCHWVEEGEAGLASATRGNYDVILLDIMLPDIDGYEVLQRLHQENVDTPVILQTGIIERDKAIHGLSLGVTDYMVKPYGKAEIIARIEAVLERAQHRASSKNGHSQPSEDTSERRRNPRVALVKLGQIIYHRAICVMDCVILNFSDHGAALRLEGPYRLPASFRLRIHRGPTYHCEVCWRHGNKLGIRFLNTYASRRAQINIP